MQALTKRGRALGTGKYRSPFCQGLLTLRGRGIEIQAEDTLTPPSVRLPRVYGYFAVSALLCLGFHLHGSVIAFAATGTTAPCGTEDGHSGSAPSGPGDGE